MFGGGPAGNGSVRPSRPIPAHRVAEGMSPVLSDSSRISPTAHYTAYVWYRAGLSYPALATPRGRAFHSLFEGISAACGRFVRTWALDAMLVRRHLVIDHLLERAISERGVRQVVEIAAGLSPRGLRFMAAHRERGLVYVEGDLPEMAAVKRQRLGRAGLIGAGHHVVTLDALADLGPESLPGVAERLLDPARPTAVITEGLLGYFGPETAQGVRRRIGAWMAGLPASVYLADVYFASESRRTRGAKIFRRVLSTIARGRTHYTAETLEAGAALVREAGLGRVEFHVPRDLSGVLPLPRFPGRDVVRILEAWNRE